MIQLIGGEESLYTNIVYVQYAMMFISIILFYLCIKEITDKKILQGLGTIIYGICPFIFTWNNLILTESFSISGLVLLVFILLKYLKNTKKSTIILANILLFLLIMLRPAFIYLLPMVILYIIFIYQRNKKIVDLEEEEIIKNKTSFITGIISFGIVILLILGYCTLMKINHGDFTITTVSDINRQILTINNGNFRKASNENIKAYIEYQISQPQGYDPTQIYNDVYKIFNKEDVDQFFYEAVENESFIQDIKYIIKKAVGISDEKIGTTYMESGRKNTILDKIGFATLPINFMHVYLILCLAFIYFLYKYKKHKVIDIKMFMLSVIILANLFTNLIAAPGELQRLFASSLPIMIMIIIYLIEIFMKNINFNTEE